MNCCANPENIGEVNICYDQSEIIAVAAVAGDYEIELLDNFGNIVGRKKATYTIGQSIFFNTSDFSDLNEDYSYIIQLYFCPQFKAKYLESCYTFKTVYYAISTI